MSAEYNLNEALCNALEPAARESREDIEKIVGPRNLFSTRAFTPLKLWEGRFIADKSGEPQLVWEHACLTNWQGMARLIKLMTERFYFRLDIGNDDTVEARFGLYRDSKWTYFEATGTDAPMTVAMAAAKALGVND